MSLFKPRIVNPDSATKIKRDYGTRVSSVIQTDTTHSGLPRDTVTGPAATIPATHSGLPRDTLTGPIPTFLATFITTTVLGHPRDTVTGPEATALTTAIGSLGTIPGHPRDTMTGSVPKDEAAWTNVGEDHGSLLIAHHYTSATANVTANATTLTSVTTPSGHHWLETSSSIPATGPRVTRVCRGVACRGD